MLFCSVDMDGHLGSSDAHDLTLYLLPLLPSFVQSKHGKLPRLRGLMVLLLLAPLRLRSPSRIEEGGRWWEVVGTRGSGSGHGIPSFVSNRRFFSLMTNLHSHFDETACPSGLHPNQTKLLTTSSLPHKSQADSHNRFPSRILSPPTPSPLLASSGRCVGTGSDGRPAVTPAPL